MKRQEMMPQISAVIIIWAIYMILVLISVDKPAVKSEPVPAHTPPASVSVPFEQEPVENPVDNVDNFVEDEPVCEQPMYTDEQLEILAIIIYQEAGADYCSDDTRRKVGSVFLNRIDSPLFSDDFEEVATARKQYGELYWTGIKWPDRASKEEEAHAVERAYDIAEELLTTGSVLPDNVIYQAEFIQGDGIYRYQDGIYFCYSEVNK